MQIWKNYGRTLKRVLIAGFSTRHVASSAERAGLEVVAIDHFCDLDLKACTIASYRFEELIELEGIIREVCTEYSPDAIVLTSGVEDLTGLPVPVLGTDPIIASHLLDKSHVQQFFEAHGIPIPKILEEGEFPAMLKPCKGSGGWRNQAVKNETEIKDWEDQFPGDAYILQEFVDGIPASVCCVTDGSRAIAIAVNQQLMRGGTEASYGFCGSVTPFSHPKTNEMVRYATRAASASGCLGVIGVDFIVSNEKIWAIELNPRFVATLDTIEMSTGLNLFSLHKDACCGVLPDAQPVPYQTAMRRILFAPHDITIEDDLASTGLKIADIPPAPAFFEKGDAIISAYGTGSDPDAAASDLDTTIRSLTKHISQW